MEKENKNLGELIKKKKKEKGEKGGEERDREERGEEGKRKEMNFWESIDSIEGKKKCKHLQGECRDDQFLCNFWRREKNENYSVFRMIQQTHL